MLRHVTTIHGIAAVVAASFLFIGGCASKPAGNQDPVAVKETPIPAPGRAAAKVAIEQVGTPYRYGGAGRSGFDCSGLVHYAYLQVGKQIPRTTGELWRQLTPVPATDLRAGDILFFNIDGKMSHVGLYLGDRQFVHAPSTGKHVSVAELNSDFYRQAFIRAGRP